MNNLLMISKEDLFAFSILIAGVIAIVRFRRMDKLFLPFIVVTWIAGLNEILAYSLMVNGHHTAINNNIYVLAEGLLFITFLRNMTVFEERPSLYKIFIAGFIIVWLAENIVLGKITGVSSVFRIVSSVSLVFISVSLLSKAIVFGSVTGIRKINRPPIMLICIGVIVFFTFKLLVEIFWLYGFTRSQMFRVKLYDILIYVNLTVNLIYAIAILWIRKKPQYIMLY